MDNDRIWIWQKMYDSWIWMNHQSMTAGPSTASSTIARGLFLMPKISAEIVICECLTDPTYCSLQIFKTWHCDIHVLNTVTHKTTDINAVAPR